MRLRIATPLGCLLLLTGCGDREDVTATNDQVRTPSGEQRRSTFRSTSTANVPAPSTRKSSLVSIAQLKADLGARTTVRGLLVELPTDVLFDYDAADVRADANSTLDKLATLARNQQGAIQVEGHSDGNGDDAYNLALSKRRADAVVGALVQRGVEAGRLRAVGLGETKPVAPNASPDGADNPAGRQRNRRVDVILPL
ncbi:OmpA family protein [Sphingomonas sp. LY29]|uniref:OmpA family protein n=1 Tax=Sphingomonas sp. LY29 TaxID=3095341 RepID=UPI002D76F573|nr:OmpA family protein [Sphingomonas sp. LY29]WRP25440.1 OmpA family protein [Sphingomonas sp. LY29]